MIRIALGGVWVFCNRGSSREPQTRKGMANCWFHDDREEDCEMYSGSKCCHENPETDEEEQKEIDE